MTVLGDRSLRRLFGPEAAVGPASVDLHLGEELIRLPYGVTLDPEVDQSKLWTPVPRCPDGRWRVGIQTLCLGATVETVAVPTNMVAFLHGCSSLGRLGLLIHVTAGLIDPGNTLQPTLELFSLAGAIMLRPGMKIGQVTYHHLDAAAAIPYAGKYLGDTAPVPSRSHQDARKAS